MVRYISIGPWCTTAEALKEAHLRDASYPFDWLFSCPYIVADCIENNFNRFLDKTYYIPNVHNNNTDHSIYGPMARNTQEYILHHEYATWALPGPVFNHHALWDLTVFESFQRKCDRFMKCIRNTYEPVILVYTQAYTRNMDDVSKLSYVLEVYPHVYILCMQREINKERSGEIDAPVNHKNNVFTTTFYVDDRNGKLTGEQVKQAVSLLSFQNKNII